MLKRNMDTLENRQFWKFVEETARKVSNWPPWKRGGCNILANIDWHGHNLQFYKNLGENGAWGLHLSGDGSSKTLLETEDLKQIKKLLAEMLSDLFNKALGKRRGVRYMSEMVESAVKGDCHYEEWMRNCVVLVRANLIHDILLVYALPNRKSLGIHYKEWRGGDCGRNSRTLMESKIASEITETFINSITR